MFNPASVLTVVPTSRKAIAGTAAIAVGAHIVHCAALWKSYVKDPAAFDAKYPDAK